jgi:serine-type D-Ala-D-Ala carboxypeptidase (penicillin-binding protein 5/6)
MKIYIAVLLSITLIFGGSINKVEASVNPPVPSADSAVLMDAETGKILYSKNMDIPYPPASTTKIMTALLALETTKLEDEVTVGKKPPYADGSKIGVREGEIFTVKDLLYGLMLESGNDSAEALAEHMGGTIEGFAEMMNKRARELGALNTNFVNPSGLYNEGHKMSARDLALIMREVSKYDEFKKISTTAIYKIEPTNKCDVPRYANNRNKLMLKNNKLYYKDAIGSKTGWTSKSQYSYVAAAEKNGQRLIVALVHDSKNTFYNDTINLFEYGFNNFELKRLYFKGQEVASHKVNDQQSIPLLASRDFFYITEKGNTAEPTYQISEGQINTKVFVKGDPLTEAVIYLNGSQLGTLMLETGIDYEIKPAATIISVAQKSKTIASGVLKYIFYTFITLILILFVLLMIRKRNLRKRRLKRMRYYDGRYSNSKRY